MIITHELLSRKNGHELEKKWSRNTITAAIARGDKVWGHIRIVLRRSQMKL